MGFEIKNKSLYSLVSFFIFAICGIWIYKSYDWSGVFGRLGGADKVDIFIFLPVLVILFFFVRAHRWVLLLKSQGFSPKYLDAWLATVISIGLANYTPFQLGEVVKLELIRKNCDINRIDGYASLVVERILDMFSLALIAFFGVLYIARESVSEIFGYLLLLGGVLFVFICLLFKNILQKKFHRFVSSLSDCISCRRTMFSVVVLTVFAWILIVLCWMVCLKSVQVNLEFFKVAVMMGVSSSVGIATFIPGGVGVVELSNTRILDLLGYDSLAAQSASIIVRVYGLWMLLFSIPPALFLYLKFKPVR